LIYPKNFESKIGFDRIRNLLKEFCLSSLGKQKVDEIAFLTDYDFIKISLELAHEFKEICLFEADFPTSFYFDVRPFLKKIRIEGTYLTVEELFDLKRSLESIKAIISFFKNTREDKYVQLRNLAQQIALYPFVVDKINNLVNKFGQIKDNASPELHSIRKDLMNKQASVSGIMNKLLKQAQSEGWIEQDTSITIRDGKMLIPISASNKRKIKGIVQDESATGKTSFIEPLESIELNNEIRELEFAEKREIIKILIEFSDAIRPYIDDLMGAYEFLATIDFIRSKALFAIETLAEKPLLSSESIIDFRHAKHPLLYLSHRKEKKIVVPLDIELNTDQRIIVISGPNAGGKSVCLKTVGLLQYMVQCGLLIPVNKTSKAGIFTNLFIDIGDEQSIENDLSTYSSHLLNMKNFVDYADESTLILIDEFGTGTEPMMGGAIAESILDILNRFKVRGVITTHYTNLKHFATSAEGIENGAMLFDSANLQPLFQLEIGKPGSSFAFEIARKIGLSDHILANAEQKAGKQHIDFDKHLQEFEQEKRDLLKLRNDLELKEKQLNDSLIRYNQEMEQTQTKRKEIITKTLEQSKEILDQVNKRVENAIFEIKKAGAEKEKTQLIRKELDDFKHNTLKHQQETDLRINSKINKIKEHQAKRKKRKEERLLESQSENSNGDKTNSSNSHQISIDPVIRIGDSVKLQNQDTTGEVIEIKGDTATVVFGNIQMGVKIDSLQKLNTSGSKNKQSSRVTVKVNWNGKMKSDFVYGLDVRGKRTEEAIQRLEKYMDEAIVAQASELKILHGTGNGILKKMLREYLRTIPFVKSLTDEKIELGGAGITIIEMEY